MSFQNIIPVAIPTTAIDGVAKGATVNLVTIPFKNAVPPFPSAAGKGFAMVTGRVHAYDGTFSGFKDAVFKIDSAAAVVPSDDTFDGDASVTFSYTMVVNGLGDLVLQVTNPATNAGPIDICIVNGLVQYFHQ